MEDAEEKVDWSKVLDGFKSDAPPNLAVLYGRRFDTSKVGCVYVIVEEGATTPCKIGWALNLYARRHGLNIGNPRSLVVKGSVQLERVEGQPELSYRGLGKAFEEKVHAELAWKRLRGEWFDIECEDALAVLVRVKAGLG